MGDADGLLAREVEGDAVEGDSGRRNGDVRGEPIESGEGLYVAGRDCVDVSKSDGLPKSR